MIIEKRFPKNYFTQKDVHIKNELFGWRLLSGKDHIDCQCEAEAEYLKIWLEAGLDEVKVPEDESYLSKILSELKGLKEKIDAIISDHISSLRAIGHHQPETSAEDFTEAAGEVV